MQKETRAKTEIARDYIVRDVHTEPLSDSAHCSIKTIYDFLRDREIVIAKMVSKESSANYAATSTMIQVKDGQATWSLVADNRTQPNGLKNLDPLSVTYDGSSHINYLCTYMEDGHIAQVQVEPFLESDDISELEWDYNAYTRLIVDFTDGPRWWQRQADPLTRQLLETDGGYFPNFNDLRMTPKIVGSLRTNSIVDSVPIHASLYGQTLSLALHRRDGLIKTIEVPIRLNMVSYQKIMCGDIDTILNFNYHLFTGSVAGDRIPPDDMLVGVI